MPTEPISICIAGISDAALLAELGARTFRETYEAHNTAENMRNYLAEHFSAGQLRKEMEEPGALFFLARAGEEIAGYTKLRPGRALPELEGMPALELERIYVLEAFKGRKIGYQLVQYGAWEGQARGCRFLWLGVWEKNTQAIAFYQHIGFQIFGRQYFQLGDDRQDDFLMKLDLGQFR